MNLAGHILRWLGWTVECTTPAFPKCVVCVAPHTSNVDFSLGFLAWASLGRRASFLMKSSWFFFPLGYLFKAMGGIPVRRSKRPGDPSLVDTVIERFRSADRLTVAVTPEGTRARTTRWHTGFLRIARGARVPILLGVLDFATHRILLNTVFTPSGDVDADLRRIKQFYAPFRGKNPDNFTTDE